ncbi:arginine decarboxylase, partial [Pseudomonas sp. GP01-A3]
MSGFKVYDMLADEYKIQIELAEPNVILAIISLGDNEETIQKLLDALRDISDRFYGKLPKLDTDISVALKNPKMVMTPREAYYHPK